MVSFLAYMRGYPTVVEMGLSTLLTFACAYHWSLQREVVALRAALDQTEGHETVSVTAPTRRLEGPLTTSMIHHTVHPLMREWGFAGGEAALARMLSTGGFGQVIVDVGLGEDGLEMQAAVTAGFVVIAFEPSPVNFRSVRTKVASLKQAMRSKYHFVECMRDSKGAWIIPVLEAPSKQGGFAYVLFAAEPLG